MSALMAHDWPGNVRELRNAADRFVLGLGEVVPGVPAPGEVAAGADSVAAAAQGTLPERLDAVEKANLMAELRRHGGSLTATYESLRPSRPTPYHKLHRPRLRQA